jgi:hypothetical protein
MIDWHMHLKQADSAKLDFATAIGIECDEKDALLLIWLAPWWWPALDEHQLVVMALTIQIAIGRMRVFGEGTVERIWVVRLYYITFLQFLLLGMRMQPSKHTDWREWRLIRLLGLFES